MRNEVPSRLDQIGRYAALSIVALALAGCTISPIAHAGEALPRPDDSLNAGKTLVDTCKVMGPDGIYTVHTGELMSKADAQIALGEGTRCFDDPDTYSGYTPSGDPYQVDVSGLSQEEIDMAFGQGTGDPGR